MTAAVDLMASVVLGGMVFLVGLWGRRNADSLLPPTLPERDRARRASVYRRGARACQVVGVLLVGAGLLSVLW